MAVHLRDDERLATGAQHSWPAPESQRSLPHASALSQVNCAVRTLRCVSVCVCANFRRKSSAAPEPALPLGHKRAAKTKLARKSTGQKARELPGALRARARAV